MTELPDGFIDGENVSYDPGTAGDEGAVVEAPEIIPATAYDNGTQVPPADPETVEAFHVYTRDVADTDLVYTAGAPIDTEAIRKWIVDRGYPVISVDAELDADGASTTGNVVIRTPIVAPDIVVALSRDDEVSNNSTSSLTTYIAATAISGVTGHTYSGTITYGATFWSSDDTGMVRVRPMVNGTQQTVDDLSVGASPQQLTFPIDVVALPATGTLGLTFRNFTSGATAYIANGFITGTLTSDQPKGEEIPDVEWATYAGVRDQAIVETVVAWDDTAEGATVAVPDPDRIMALQMHIERNGYEVQQITGEWNFMTPDTAPVAPELRVYARGAIDTAVTDAFLYSEIQQADRDAFRIDWIAAVSQSVLRRKVQGQVLAPGQDDRSAPYFFFVTVGIPTGDIREGDIWYDGSNYFSYINGEWAPLASFVFTNESSTATGRQSSATGHSSTATGAGSIASAPSSTATGAESEATGEVSTATGYGSRAHYQSSTATGAGSFALNIRSVATGAASNATGLSSIVTGAQSIASGGFSIVTGSASNATHARSIVEGSGANSIADDTKTLKVNDEVQQPSTGSGRTRKGLHSPDGTRGWISVTDDDRVAVNDVPAAKQSELHAALTATDSAEIDFTLTGQDLTASIQPGSIGPTKLDREYVEASVMTTRGDIIVQNSAGDPARMAIGSANQALMVEPGGLFLQYRSVMLQVASVSVSVNPTSIAANSAATTTVTVSGAAVGDLAIANPTGLLTAGITLRYVYVSSADTVAFSFQNLTAAAIDPPALNWRVLVIRPA